MRFAVLILLSNLTFVFSADGRKDDPWVSMEEGVKIWDEVVAKELGLPLPLPEPKPYVVSSNGLEATFEKNQRMRYNLFIRRYTDEFNY